MGFKNNCCDGIYNSIDVHFTSACDNACKHCVDMRFSGLGISRPEPFKIARSVIFNSEGVDDVLFLGGEPCLYLQELIVCIDYIKTVTDLKVFVTTSVPKTCYDNRGLFTELLSMVDGINLSVQHNDETIADDIRNVGSSKYDRQALYESLPFKDKIRINLNLVKPHLHTKSQIMECLHHYDDMGFGSIKISEIQHGSEFYTSFCDVFELNLGSPYWSGCQTYISLDGINTPILLKRSCFLCEETLAASAMDAIKVISKVFVRPTNKYCVVYGNGKVEASWV